MIWNRWVIFSMSIDFPLHPLSWLLKEEQCDVQQLSAEYIQDVIAEVSPTGALQPGGTG